MAIGDLDTGASETGTDGVREEGGSTEEGAGGDLEEDSRGPLRRESSLIKRLIPTWRGQRGFSTKKLMNT